MDRRKLLQMGTVGTVFSTLAASAATSKATTPAEMEGPFYPVIAQNDKDFDLTMIEGHENAAKGKHIFISGRVVDTEGNTIEGVTVDIWQANAAGRYAHPHDENPAPLDPDFQSWGIMQTNRDGVFNFKTVYPGAYPASKDWSRPPHIHFKITKKGYSELTTQMYFPGEELNNTDRLIARKSLDEQAMMIAKLSDTSPETYEYTVVIERA